MSMEETITKRNIRWLALMILREQRRRGKAESGGWLRESLLRKLLAAQGYDLSTLDLREYMIYLQDPEIGCTETRKDGDTPPYVYKYRLTAKGIRAVDEEEKVPGIGINNE